MSATAFQRRRRKLVNQESSISAVREFDVPVETSSPKLLVEYTVKELRDMCKKRGLKGYSNKSEAELIEMLSESE